MGLSLSEAYEYYLRVLSEKLMQQPLSRNDREKIAVNPSLQGVQDVLQGWRNQSRFSKSVRRYFEVTLGTSGERDGIDYSLPGNLIEWVVRENRPIGDILTHNQCFDQDLSSISCDNLTPVPSGIITTRAFLVANRGRFHIARANKVLNVFACLQYPLPAKLEPRVKKESLLEPFQNKHDSEIVRNGPNCHNCHGQFAHHTQLFIRFDRDGRYVKENSYLGLQDPDRDFGTGFGTFYPSHFIEKKIAQSDETRFFGQPVRNIREAMNILISSQEFSKCMVETVLHHSFGKPFQSTSPVILDYFNKMIEPKISFFDLYLKILGSDPVVHGYLQGQFDDIAIPETRISIVKDKPIEEKIEEDISFDQYQGLFKEYCGKCHNWQSEDDFVLRKSKIIDAVSRGTMPPEQALSESDRAKFMKWFSSGQK